jgi:photosystem II stability/assembly factor-like uncharacterized protein
VWSFSGTGGVAFDPVSATVAYRSLGLQGPEIDKTTDGGRTFTEVGQLPFAQGETSELLFLDESQGYAIASAAAAPTAALYETSNGGSTWRQVTF